MLTLGDYKAALEKHRDLYLLFKDHKYMPDGSATSLRELAKIHAELGYGTVKMYCKACIGEMLKTLYNGYEQMVGQGRN